MKNPLSSAIGAYTRKSRPWLAGVQRQLFRRLLAIFLIAGLPALVIGALHSLRQGRWAFVLVYGLLYLLAVLVMAVNRRLPFGVAAGAIVTELFALAVAVFMRLGLSGTGIPLLIACCLISMSLFGVRGALVAIAASLVVLLLLGLAFAGGLVPSSPGMILDPRSFASWLDVGAVFLMITAAMIAIQQAFILRIEKGMESRERDAEALARSNALLREEVRSRREAEEALRGSEERYRLIVENARDAIFISQDGIMKFPNRRTEELVGFSRAELETIPFAGFIHPEDRPRVLDNYGRRLRGESAPSLYSFRVIDRKGETVWIELNSVRCLWEGRPASLNLARDITAQKTLEARSLQGQKLEAIGTLAGGVAHDFNNILQVILGYAELLIEEGGGEVREMAEIRQAAARGTSLVRQLLTFSRQLESSLAAVDLNVTVQAVRDLLSRLLPKMIGISLELNPGLEPVAADAGQIEQVLMNLAINARDAMPDGGSLTLATARSALDEEFCRPYPDMHPGTYVSVRVTDTGRGIPADILPRIFEPFFTTKEAGKGTGLGLAMAYGIVRNHHGAITCESVPGVGTTFVIHLPLARAGLASAAPGVEQGLATGSGTILLVDDDETVRILEERILRRAGYTVLAAASCEEALASYRAGRGGIDLVILDLIMPGMGGWRCLEEMHEVDPGARVLVASGHMPDGDSWESRGAVGLVRKPYTISGFLAEVKRALEARSGPARGTGAGAP
jgi:two-component system, cell cycle sensor histidine kinase and response regulator CckA